MNHTSIDPNEVTTPPPPTNVFIEYRIYYDEDGNIIMCAMVQHPPDTNYIVVSKEEYENYMRYRVKNGKLEKIRLDTSNLNYLRKCDSGFRVVAGHAPLLLEPSENWESIEYYDYR